MSIIFSFLLFLFPDYSYAQYASVQDGLIEKTDNQNFLEKQRKCFEPWFEEIQKPKRDLDQIKYLYSKGLTCIDPCISDRDAFYLADECYDWNQAIDLLTGHSTLNSVLETVFEHKLNKCSAEKLARARKNRDLDGYYFDPQKNSCFDSMGTPYINALIKTVNLIFGLSYISKSGIDPQDALGVFASLDHHGYIRKNEALMTWTFKIDSALSIKSFSPPGYAFNEAAFLEGGLYKVFGKNCAPILGVNATADGRLDISKDGLYPAQLRQGGASAKASFGMVCNNLNDMIMRVELQGELISFSVFVVPELNNKIVPLIRHAGRQVNAKLSYFGKTYMASIETGIGSFIMEPANILDWYAQVEYFLRFKDMFKNITSDVYGGGRVEIHNYMGFGKEFNFENSTNDFRFQVGAGMNW